MNIWRVAFTQEGMIYLRSKLGLGTQTLPFKEPLHLSLVVLDRNKDPPIIMTEEDMLELYRVERDLWEVFRKWRY